MSDPCHCRRCNDKPIPWFLSPSILQELMLRGVCPTCWQADCPHAADHDAMCAGRPPEAT